MMYLLEHFLCQTQIPNKARGFTMLYIRHTFLLGPLFLVVLLSR
jgi:hypothetical protein